MSLAHDVRLAVRVARKSPVATVTILTTLAFCIGANALVFSVVDGALLRAIPYPEPDRLVEVALERRRGGEEVRSFGHDGATWEELRHGVRLVELAAVNNWLTAANFAHGAQVGNARLQRVSAGFFEVLSVAPWMGRPFTEDEDRPGGPAVVVLSHEFWRRVLGEDPQVLGESLLLRGEPHTIVGVMPAGFRSTARADVWSPLRPSRAGEGGGQNYEIVGRLAEGASLRQASLELEAVGQKVLAGIRIPPGTSARFVLSSLKEALTRDLRRPLILSFGAVAAVLLIGCVNLASLFLSRGVDRSRELGVRIALGGGRGAILRELLTESALYAFGGGLTGLVLANLALSWLRVWGRDTFPFFAEASLDARVLFATACLSALACLLFGGFPAFQAWKLGTRTSLAGARGITGGKNRALGLLVLGQVALTVPLLVAATLLVRSFAHLSGLEPGFDGTNVVAAKVSLHDSRYETAVEVNRLLEGVLARVAEAPGVEAAAAALAVPYERWLNLPFRRAGEDENQLTTLDYVTPHFFRVLGVPLLRGRTSTEADWRDSDPVVLVSRAFVDRYFPSEEPLGAILQMNDGALRIVGVVGDVPQRPSWGTAAPLATSIPAAYIPLSQASDELLRLVHVWFSPSFLVKANGPASLAMSSIEDAIARLDPLLPVFTYRTLAEVESESLALPGALSAWFSAYAGLAAALAGVGLYGMAARLAASRGKEIGLRIALGATVSHAAFLTMVPALRMAALGAAAGIGLSFLASRSLRHLLWGIEATDPASLAAVAIAMLFLASTASLLPALRVATLDPVRKLRED